MPTKAPSNAPCPTVRKWTNRSSLAKQVFNDQLVDSEVRKGKVGGTVCSAAGEEFGDTEGFSDGFKYERYSSRTYTERFSISTPTHLGMTDL